MELVEKIFKLKDNQTTVKTELVAGLTTFFTMSYLLVLSPKLLEIAGLSLGSTLTATALMVFIGSLLMAFIANKPYAVAPFLGETAFVAFTITSTLGFSIKTALASICVSGILLLVMTLSNVRTMIVEQIPQNIKYSFCCGLGLFFIFIALKDIGIVLFTNNSIPLISGNFTTLPILLGIFCFVFLITLLKKNIKGSVVISIITTTILGMIFGDVKLPLQLVSLPINVIPSLLQTDFSTLFTKDFIPIFFVIFLLVNIDTAGAIIALTCNSSQNEKKFKKEMIADSLSVILAPLLGTTTSGAYLDSMTGMNAGGKTGLTAITVGFLFLIGLFFTPLIMIIPPYAYAPVLIYVGILMVSSITLIDFKDISELAPAILTISIMIFTYNIGIGIVFGFLIYPLIQLLTGQIHKTNKITWILFVVSILFFIIYPY